MRALLSQKKGELEGMLGDYEQRLEETEEHNQTLAAEKQKIKNQLIQIEEQLVTMVTCTCTCIMHIHVHIQDTVNYHGYMLVFMYSTLFNN